MWKWEETAGKKSRWVCIQEGLAPAPGRVDPAAAWDGHPLLHRRVADDVAGLQRAVGVLEVAEEEEPVAGVEEADEVDLGQRLGEEGEGGVEVDEGRGGARRRQLGEAPVFLLGQEVGQERLVLLGLLPVVVAGVGILDVVAAAAEEEAQ